MNSWMLHLPNAHTRWAKEVNPSFYSYNVTNTKWYYYHLLCQNAATKHAHNTNILTHSWTRIFTTRMWTDAQRDCHPAGYVALSAQCRKVWLTPTTWVPCSNAANIAECRTWMQREFCTLQNSIRGQTPENVYIVYQPTRRPSIVQSLVDLCWATSVQ